jgi:hypothetical protein
MTDISLEDIQGGPQTTADTQLTIKVSNDNPLPIGSNTFELTVIDDSGNTSVPAQVIVIVRDTTRPTAVLRVADFEGRPLPGNVLEFGASFILNAKGSLDAPPGQISKYVWTLLN